MWDWGSEQQAAFVKTNILAKQIKALGVSHARLPFHLDVSVTPAGTGQALWQRQRKERVPPGFGSQLWEGAETGSTPIEPSSYQRAQCSR